MDQTIGLQILQASTCQFLAYNVFCNNLPAPLRIYSYVHANTSFVQTNTHLFPQTGSKNPERDRQSVAGGSWVGHNSPAGQTGRKAQREIKRAAREREEAFPAFTRPQPSPWPWPVQAHTIHTCTGHTSYSVGRAQSALDTS